MPRTVLFVISTLESSGPVHVLHEIIRHLDRDRYTPFIATLSSEATRSCISGFHEEGIPVVSLDLMRTSSLLAGPRRLRTLSNTIDARLVHTHGFRADLIAANTRLTCPIVSTLHCDLHVDYTLAYGRLLGPLMAHSQYRALRRFHAVAAVSSSLAGTAHATGIDTCVVPNGVDTDLFRPPANRDEVVALRSHFGWPTDATVVLHLGALIQRKDPLAVLRAFRSSKLARNALLVFAGEGPLRAECQRFADGDARIHFLGARRDVPQLLRAADLLVSHSSSEGLPMALLEGCATGIKVLASSIPSHEEMRELFPHQVTLFSGVSSLIEALDVLACSSAKHNRLFNPAGGLQNCSHISARSMSLRYQDLYDTQLILASNAAYAAPGLARQVQQKE